MTSDAAARGRLAALLGQALAGPVRAVFALRSEFQDQLLALPEFADISVADSIPLQPLSPEKLREVIEQPARVAGISVEEEFVARLVADTDTDTGGGALPLLAFTLNELAQGLDRGDSLSPDLYDGSHGAFDRFGRCGSSAYQRSRRWSR